MHTPMAWILAAAQMAAAPAASTLPDHLTLDGAMAQFVAHGFDLLLADADVAGSEGDAWAAAAFANPEVSGTVSHAGRPYQASLCPPGQCSTTGYTVNVTDQAGLLDVATGKRGLRRDVGAMRLAAAQHGRDDAARLLGAGVKSQYLAVALDQALVQFATETAATFAQSLTLFSDRYGAGDISEADLVRMQVAVLDAQQQVDAAQGSLVDDRLALGMLMGLRGPVPEFTVDAPWPSAQAAQALIDRPIGHYLAQAQEHRPDLQASTALAQSSQRAASLAVRQRLPDATLSFNYQQFGTGQNSIQPRTYTGGLSLALPLLYQNQGEVARARADARRAEVQAQKLAAQVESDVRRSHAALSYAYARAARSRDHMLADADRALQLVRLQYTKGAASLLDLLDAQRTHIAVNQAYFANLGDFWGALIALEQAVAAEVSP